MKNLILSSFLVIGVSGCVLARTNHTPVPTLGCGSVVTADLPMPDPNSPKKPDLVADLPMPDPNSPKKPDLVADLPMPDPNSPKKPDVRG